jgi:hypothetical protein
MGTFQFNDPDYVHTPFIGTENYNGSLNNGNPSDVYQVRIAGLTGSLNLKLNGLSDNADLLLVRDTNGNRQVDASDQIINTANKPGTASEDILTGGLNEGDYLIQVSQVSGATDYSLTVHSDGIYNFTYFYGNGDYYKGVGYAQPGEYFQISPGVFHFADEDFFPPGHYEINLVQSADVPSQRGTVHVRTYYDRDSGVTADTDPSGGENGHLHPYPYNASTDPNFGSTYLGIGNQGLGSEAGLIHLDGHPNGFPLGIAASDQHVRFDTAFSANF